MYDHGKETVELVCVVCNTNHSVTLQQIADETTIRCSCDQLMILKDHGGRARLAIIKVNALKNISLN